MVEAAMEGAQRSTADRAASVRRLDAVKEILRALETATVAGQQHLMVKVIDLLRREAPARDRRLGDQAGWTISATLDALAREARRLAPDADAFRVLATQVVDAIGPS